MTGVMNPTAGWHRDTMMKFVSLYKERPCLWQTDLPSYRNKKERTEALVTMVAEMDIMGFDLEYCKIKIKNIRSHYCQELKKIQVSQALNNSKPYVPNIIWFEFLDEFLREYVHLNNPAELIEDSMVSVEIHDTKDEAKNNCEVTKKLVSKKRPGSKIKYFKRRKATEFDVFCKSIAIHLKKMPLQDALNAQVQIQNLVAIERLKTVQ